MTEHVVDLLGVLAYTELTAFSRLAADAEHAPALAERMAMADLAAGQYRHFHLLTARIVELGARPQDAMAPYVASVDAYHDRTRPNGWPERLVKAYVGDEINSDFYRELAIHVDSATAALVEEVVTDSAGLDVIAQLIRSAVEADPRLAGRLALWARRLVGEALSQAQRIVIDRDALAVLLVGDLDLPADDLNRMTRVLGRLTDRHTDRLRVLGLAP